MMGAEVRLLGEVQICLDSRPIDVGHARQQSVLAVLAIEANRSVAVDVLVERVWGGRRAPERPVNVVQTYVSLLRRALSQTSTITIRREPSGYLLAVDPQTVDLHRFSALTSRARAGVEDGDAAGLLGDALALWRGEPFAALDTPWLATVRAMLAEQRLAAQLDLADIELRLGRHNSLVPGLLNLVELHPLNERLAGQLMLALYRSGRQADALAEYRRVWRALAKELGVDAGLPLRTLHERILVADPALALATVSSAAETHSVVPRQLPASPRLFSGRTQSVALLDTVIRATDKASDTMPIAVISGAGGIGKTWLALHWAHRNIGRFPDGQLYLNLHGFDPLAEPVSPAGAVWQLLTALGVVPAAIPVDLDARCALYRSLTAGRRMLVVLDNARDTTHVRMLLPGSRRCTVLVTSRNQLVGLVAEHGASPVNLTVLPEVEARKLLTRRLGPDRMAAEPDAFAEVLDVCGGLPLALSIVAARVALRPQAALSDILERIQDAARRLSAFDADDLTVGLRAVFGCSYRALAPGGALLFGLLGLMPGPTFGVAAVASLAGLPLGHTRDLLNHLETAHLVLPYGRARYQMHDLLHQYSIEVAKQVLTEADRVAALCRLIDFYLHTACAGERLLAPHRDQPAIDPPAPGCAPITLDESSAALAWFDTEHSDLLGVHRIAVQQGWHSKVWQLAWALTTYHMHRGHLHDQRRIWQAALAAGTKLRDPTVLSLAHRFLGFAETQLGCHEASWEHLRRALQISDSVLDVGIKAHTHRILAWASGKWGENEQALGHASRAAALFAELEDEVWYAVALNTVGWFHAQLGDYDAATRHCQQALERHRQHDHPEAEADTLDSLGYIHHRTASLSAAIEHYRAALLLYCNLGYSYQEANTLNAMAEVHADAGEYDLATVAWRQAIDLYRTQSRTCEIERTQRRLTTLATQSAEQVRPRQEDTPSPREQVGPS